MFSSRSLMRCDSRAGTKFAQCSLKISSPSLKRWSENKTGFARKRENARKDSLAFFRLRKIWNLSTCRAEPELMKKRIMKTAIAITLSLLLLLTNLSAVALANEADPQATVELRGTVLDETNAYIPAAPVTLDDGKGTTYTTQSDERGRYHFNAKPGVYTLTVEVEGFAKFVDQIDLSQKRKEAFDVKLKVSIAEQVEVKDNSAISTEPDKNLSAITLTEKDLEALPDDPDELLETLKQMAGAAAAGDAASVYVGGFRERGQIPPKEAILRISINQNPFSAEYSEPGNFRIDIITKPGADTFHGGVKCNS